MLFGFALILIELVIYISREVILAFRLDIILSENDIIEEPRPKILLNSFPNMQWVVFYN